MPAIFIQYISLGIAILLLVMLAQKLKIANPIILVVGGLLLSLIPGTIIPGFTLALGFLLGGIVVGHTWRPDIGLYGFPRWRGSALTIMKFQMGVDPGSDWHKVANVYCNNYYRVC